MLFPRIFVCVWCGCIVMNNYTYTYACRIITTTQLRRATQFFRKIYVSFYWKGCVWEGVGDRKELQHIDPHSYGHNSVSFPFSWAAQTGAWRPSLSGTWSSFQHLLSNWSELQLHNRGSWGPPQLGAGFLYRILTPTDLISNWLTSCLHPGYIIIRHPPSSCGRHKSHSLNPSTVKCLYPYIPRPDAPLITRMHFLFWQLARGQYVTVCACKLTCFLWDCSQVLLWLRQLDSDR